MLVNIERFFLLNLLRIAIVGCSVILATDLILYPQDKLSVAIDVIIVGASLLSYFLMSRFYILSAMILTCTTLSTMVYQCFVSPINTTTAMSIILIVGFLFSILLTGRLMWVMHAVTVVCIIVIFFIQARNPEFRISDSSSETLTICITYLVLYFLISYCTGMLKLRYDQINQALRKANEALLEKANEVAAQHEELLQSHEQVHELNKNLERMVIERTQKVHAQNEMLLKYTYTNAHHLRGPVARLLGLISIHKLDDNPDYPFFFSKMEDQAKEIDEVVKQINSELEKK